MGKVFCTFCGKPVAVYSARQRNMYYDSLSCLECLRIPVEDTDREVTIDEGIVNSNWLKKLSLLSHRDNISGDLYHPLTGEHILDIEDYLKKAGFKL